MKPNPGGQLSSENIVGRDGLVAEMWEILDGRCIYMNDLRRIGKTMILNKMAGSQPTGWLVVKRDLEGYHTAAEFATAAFRDSEKILNGNKRIMRGMARFLEKIKGVEIAGVIKLPNGTAAPWKEVLIQTFSDLEEELTVLNARMVFLWDEVPFLIANVLKNEGPETAMEVLDVLRSLSQDYSRVRFVLTGSVGLHHVLATLRGKGYLNSPVNHMERIAPGPLERHYALHLARELIQGAGLICVEPAVSAQAIASSVGNVAFYIHKLIARWPKGKPLDPGSIDEVLDREITKPDTDWDLAHYRTRLPLYYGENENLVLCVLDAIAAATGPLLLDDIRRDVGAKVKFNDKEQLFDLIALLEQDHYLAQDPATKAYSFRFPLIRRWWRIKRGL